VWPGDGDILDGLLFVMVFLLCTAIAHYRDIFIAIDEFTALRFTVTDASPAAKGTQILPMTQHA
jgi:hypothetical protein